MTSGVTMDLQANIDKSYQEKTGSMDEFKDQYGKTYRQSG